MQFSDEEIRLAKILRSQGSEWTPKAGHYVYDETGFCQRESPFQEKVYFILNYAYFIKAVGGVERFKEIMIWLPTWDDAREIIQNFGVSDDELAKHLWNQQAIEQGTEPLALYQLIGSLMKNKAKPAATDSGQ